MPIECVIKTGTLPASRARFCRSSAMREARSDGPRSTTSFGDWVSFLQPKSAGRPCGRRSPPHGRARGADHLERRRARGCRRCLTLCLLRRTLSALHHLAEPVSVGLHVISVPLRGGLELLLQSRYVPRVHQGTHRRSEVMRRAMRYSLDQESILNRAREAYSVSRVSAGQGIAILSEGVVTFLP